MGDRVYLSLRIHGKIETVEALHAIIQALEADSMSAETEPDFHGEFQYALEKQSPPVFFDAECNYGQLDYAEEALQEHGIAYSISHEEGGGFAAACWSWSPEHGEARAIRAHGSGPVIDVTDIEKALRTEKPLSELQALIDLANRADGADLPEFSVSDVVRAHLFPNNGNSAT